MSQDKYKDGDYIIYVEDADRGRFENMGKVVHHLNLKEYVVIWPGSKERTTLREFHLSDKCRKVTKAELTLFSKPYPYSF